MEEYRKKGYKKKEEKKEYTKHKTRNSKTKNTWGEEGWIFILIKRINRYDTHRVLKQDHHSDNQLCIQRKHPAP